MSASVRCVPRVWPWGKWPSFIIFYWHKFYFSSHISSSTKAILKLKTSGKIDLYRKIIARGWKSSKNQKIGHDTWWETKMGTPNILSIMQEEHGFPGQIWFIHAMLNHCAKGNNIDHFKKVMFSGYLIALKSYSQPNQRPNQNFKNWHLAIYLYLINKTFQFTCHCLGPQSRPCFLRTLKEKWPQK